MNNQCRSILLWKCISQSECPTADKSGRCKRCATSLESRLKTDCNDGFILCASLVVLNNWFIVMAAFLLSRAVNWPLVSGDAPNVSKNENRLSLTVHSFFLLWKSFFALSVSLSLWPHAASLLLTPINAPFGKFLLTHQQNSRSPLLLECLPLLPPRSWRFVSLLLCEKIKRTQRNHKKWEKVCLWYA